MLTKLTGLDFSKFTLTTSSGFVVATAVMFIIDSLLSGHMTENIFTDITAGKIVVFGIAIIVFSSILGLLIDSFFNSFGRYFAKHMWFPLLYELELRKELMASQKYSLIDFDWMYSESKAKISPDDESKYLRFTMVAGSAAYTMMFLLAPATYMFLRLEYNQNTLISLALAISIVVGGFILLLTSAESLSNYERKKTAAVLEYLRKPGSKKESESGSKKEAKAADEDGSLPVAKIEVKKESKLENKVESKKGEKTETKTESKAETKTETKTGDKPREVNIGIENLEEKSKGNIWDKCKIKRISIISGLILLAIIIAAGILGLAQLGISAKKRNIQDTAYIDLISQPESGNLTDNGVPTIDINITIDKDSALIEDVAAAKIVLFSDYFSSEQKITLRYPELVSSVNLSAEMKPRWKLYVDLSNQQHLKEGDNIYIYAYVSFVDASGIRLTTDNITEGEWFFPILVFSHFTEDDIQEIDEMLEQGAPVYLLAQVHVKITLTSPQASSENSTTDTT